MSEDHIITCDLAGHLTASVVKQLIQETNAYASLLRSKSKRVYLLIDISKLTTPPNSSVRSAAKRLGDVSLDRIAVAGGSRFLRMIGQYIASTGKLSHQTHFFKNRKQALKWLKTSVIARKKIPDEFWRRLGISLATIVTVGVFIGWMFDIQILKSLIASAKATNPMSAFALLVLCIGAWFISKKQMPSWRKALIIICALYAIVFGALVVYQIASGNSLGVDRVLFTSKLNNGLVISNAAPATAICLMALGGMILFIMTGQKKRWQQYGFHALSTLVVLLAYSSILGYAYGINLLYSFTTDIPVALVTAIILILLNNSLQWSAVLSPSFERSAEFVKTYWQGLTVVLVAVIVVGIAWQQSRNNLAQHVKSNVDMRLASTATMVGDRLDTYINALLGYKAFFEASDNVSQSDFHIYTNSNQILQNYPGFTSIAFLRSVPQSQKIAFLKQLKNDVKDPTITNNFNIHPTSDNDMLYPVVYVEPRSPTTNFGFDLSSDATRRDTLNTARDTGEPTSSGLINLNLTRPGAPWRPGFFITIPIYDKPEVSTVGDRRTHIFGFVNTVFEDAILFKDIFADFNQPDVRFVISYARTGDIIYTYNPDGKNIDDTHRSTSTLEVAGQTLRIDIYTTPTFGANNTERLVPSVVLVGGNILVVMIGGFIFSQTRRKQEALRLASEMTEDLNNERNLAIANQQKDDAILASIGDAVFAIDLQERITLFNPAAERISGYSASYALGRPYQEVLNFIVEATGKKNESFIQHALAGHLSSMREHTQLVRNDGKKIAVADSAAPIRDARGEQIGAIIVFRDVTREYELDKAKTEFVSLASHQLRTPLSAIGWYTEILLNGDPGKLNKQQLEMVQEIHAGNERMVDLVNSLLNVSRLEVGKLINQAVSTSLQDLATSLHKELSPSIAAKQITYAHAGDAKLPNVTADPKLLRMILQNLLSNAVKYTPDKGKVALTMRRATLEDKHAAKMRGSVDAIFISVADTGYGVPKAQQSQIFDKMFRADNARKLEVEGTGLGLYIVKEVVHKLGGGIWFESTEGKGSTFFVVLPVITKSEKATSAAGHDTIEQKHKENT